MKILSRTIAYLLFSVFCFGITAKADVVQISLDGGEVNIQNGDSVSKEINGISSSRTFGTIVIKAKWHSDTLVPGDFRRLRVDLINPKGAVVAGETGFSQHSPGDKSPKINFQYAIKETDARAGSSWKIKITNNSGLNIKDFNIRKGGDFLSPNFASELSFSCPSTRNVRLFNSPLTDREIGAQQRITENLIAAASGNIYNFRIRAKFHLNSTKPGDFAELMVHLINPKGEIVASSKGYSQHAPSTKTPKLNLVYNSRPEDTDALGTEIGMWKLEIVEQSGVTFRGFNIFSEGNELLVPRFSSTLTIPCEN